MQNENKNQSTTPWAVAAVLAVIAGLLGFLFVQQKQEIKMQSTEIVAKAREIAFTKTKLDSVSIALDEKIAEVARLGGDLTELQNVKAKLEKDMASLKRSDRVDTNKYLAKIKEYETFLQEKDTEIAQLREQNQMLVASNDSLVSKVGTLSTERETLVRRHAELTDTVNIFNAENKVLSEKVNRAAALKANNLKILAVNSRGKAKERESYKAKRIDKIKLAFDLPENALAREEQKEIYVRVLDGNGAILSNDATGSGNFTTAEGTDTKYTTLERVAYTNNNQHVEMVYDYSSPFRPGTYTVELYSEGYKIGNSNFVVR